MPAGEFLEGIGLLALSLGSALVFAAVTVSRRLSHLRGAPRAVSFGVLVALAFLAVHLVPGALGVLTKGTVAVASLLLLAASARVPRPSHAPPAEHPYPPGAASGRLSWALAAAAVGLYVTYALALALGHAGDAVQTVDMTTFHLPNIARWIQTRSLWTVSDFVPHRAFGTYPNTSDVMTLGLVLPFRNEFLVHFVNYPWLALLGAATYALARELTAPAATAVLFATGLVATPIVTDIAFDGLADTLMLATFASGVLFLIRHERTRARSDVAMAGLALGLCLGTKWYALPAVAIASCGWAALGLTGGRRRELLAPAGTLVGAVAVVGGFWLLRNLVQTGDPVFPVKVALGGITLFDAPRDIHRELFGYTIGSYLTDPHVLRHVIWPSFLAFMSWFAVFLWALLPAAGVRALLAGRRSPADGPASGRLVIALVVVAASIGLVYLVTPYTALGTGGNPVLAAANARYVMPALVIGAAVGAWLGGRLGRLRPALEAGALLALLDALRRDNRVSLGALAAGVLAAAVVLVAVWLVRTRKLGRPAPARGALAAACMALVVVGGARLQERRFNEHRYTTAEPTTRFVTLHAPSGHRVGVVGEGYIVYPMFGPRLGNDVAYVGPVEEGMLRTYHRKSSFVAALSRGRYDLVLVQGAGLVEPGLPALHERWLRQLGYSLVARGSQDWSFHQPVSLYRAPSAQSG